MRILLFLLLAVSAFAEQPLGAPLAASNRKAVCDQLLLPDPQKRAVAIVRLRCDGKDAQRDFRTALDRAKITAVANLRSKLPLVKSGDASLAALRREFANYKTLADAARALVQTDHHKDKAKLAEMDKAFTAAETAHARLKHALNPGGSAPLVQVLDAMQWLAEIRRDLDWCEGKPADLASLDLAGVLANENAPEPLKTFASELAPFISLREFHRCINTAHMAMRWAKNEQIQHADYFNDRRFVLGLGPQMLSERLCAAADQHNEEMVKLKYFAHDSPVAANKSFVERAKNAKFEGAPHGECIYMGGPTARDANTGWWYSDPHRLGMYGSNDSAQGIARFGAGTWTFLNGNFTKFPF